MPKRHPPSPQSFRADAVALVKRTGKPITEVAAALGVAGESLRPWVQPARIDAGAGPAGALTTAARAEVRHLRRQVKPLKMERAVPRKAAAFVASEPVCAGLGASPWSRPPLRSPCRAGSPPSRGLGPLPGFSALPPSGCRRMRRSPRRFVPSTARAGDRMACRGATPGGRTRAAA
jgi:transposase